MRNIVKFFLGWMEDLNLKDVKEMKQSGYASWYSLPGKRTASGEIMNPRAMTCAHKTLALGTIISVRNEFNGRVVRVRVNDRGPYIRGRIVDLSKAAAIALGMIPKGTVPVTIST